MLKIAIVEDNPTERGQLEALLRAYEARHNCPLELVGYSDGAEILEEYPRGTSLIFMDIDMKQLDGVEASRRIREFDEHVILIFLTNMPQYALAGYQVEALDYLIKPLDERKLAWEMERVLKKLETKKPAYFLAKDNYATHHINIDDIYYVETAQRKLLIHTRTRVINCNAALHEVEKQLESFHFFRIHSAYLVNMKYIRLVRENEVVVEDTPLPISRHRKKEFTEAFTAFMGSDL